MGVRKVDRFVQPCSRGAQLMGVPLTQLETLHSHLEPLRRVDRHMLEDQVTLSYSIYEDGERNVIGLKGIDFEKDPTTFYTIHCELFPDNCINL